MSDARHEPMEAAEYHAHPAIGSSMIETFRRSRREYHAKYIAKTQVDEPSDVMLFGTLVHLMLLEPDRFADEVAPPMPALGPDGEKWNRRKKLHKEAWEEEQLAREDYPLVFTEEDLKRAGKVVAAIRANRHARWLVEHEGQPEYSIFWTDPATQLECKCRVDWFSRFSIDLKTTGDPTPENYIRTCVRLGYHRRKAHYLAGLASLLDEPNPQLIHLAAETDEPFRVACFNLVDADPYMAGQSLGASQRRSTLYELAQCLDTGDFREPWEKKVVDLELPRWSFAEDQYSYTG